MLVTLSKCVMGGVGRSGSSRNNVLESWAGKVVVTVAQSIEKSLSAGME